MVTLVVSLAPESRPTIVIIVDIEVAVPKRDNTVVGTKLQLRPITVLDTLVPTVTVPFKAVASAVFIPCPVNTDANLESPMVNVYPEVSCPPLEPM